MNELAAALGMNKASIYGAYGSKEDLFRKVVERYVHGSVAFLAEALNEATASDVVRKLLTTAADFLTDQNHPPGCMVIQGALTCSPETAQIKQELTAYRRAFEQVLTKRFEQARAAHDLIATTDCAALAKLVVTLHQGMSVQAVSGATREELLRAVDIALESLRAFQNAGPDIR